MTLYEILGLSPDASASEIKAAHRRAVKAHHPDVGGDAQRFEEVQRAYSVLSDPERRARYDQTGVEEAAEAASEDQLAQAAITSLIIQFIAGNDDLTKTDIVGVIRNILINQRAAHEETCRQIDLRLQRVETIRARLHRKDDHDGALSALLAEREREFNAAKAKEAGLMGVVMRALILLEDYSYSVDPTPADEARIWLSLRA
jgi:curved DNA-binding protein CbpA